MESAIHPSLVDDFSGKNFSDFFTNVIEGKFGRSDVRYEPKTPHREISQEMDKHKSLFADHISKSIPTYHENHINKANGIVKTFSGPNAVKMLDIGSSEGYFGKTISKIAPNIETYSLDPNRKMHEAFLKTSTVPNAHFLNNSVLHGWTENDGHTVVPLDENKYSNFFDIIHESMTFQFMNNKRDIHIDFVKRLLRPNGLLIINEKLITPKDDWHRNESFKDSNFKNKFFSQKELEDKNKVVGITKEKSGMVNHMVEDHVLEDILLNNFRHVFQYWDAGNFKGYVASNDLMLLNKFLSTFSEFESEYSTRKLPRKIERKTHMNESHHHKVKHITDHIKHHDVIDKEYFKHHYGNKIKKHIKNNHGIVITDHDLNAISDELGLKEKQHKMVLDKDDYDFHL